MKSFKIFVAIFVSLQFGVFLPLAPAFAQTVPKNTVQKTVVPKVSVPVTKTTNTSSSTTIPFDLATKSNKVFYNRLMKDLKEVRVDKNLNKKDQTISNLSSFITAEKNKLDKFSISSDKKSKYLDRLEGQLKGFDTKELKGIAKVWDTIKVWIGLGTKKLVFDEEVRNQKDLPEVKVPENPAQFSFNKEIPKLESLNNIRVGLGQKIDQTLKAFITVEPVSADSSILPVVDDIRGDQGEIIINSTIKNLAADLNNNPVKIYNFVRANINYEPYYGAKKGNLGCLEEKLCNDVDAASLTISLLRAAGIPAHYKKSIMVVSSEELETILGLDKTVEGRRTVYGVFGWNKIPIFTISNNPTVGQNLDNGDFTNETHFAVEWTFPEIYYDYDERGGNINNSLDLSSANTTAEFQALLQNKYKKQWIPLDVIFKDYTRTQHEIVAETANFNSENFWYGFFQYQGGLSPINKYVADLQTATGKNVSSTAYHSYNEPSNKAYETLPPALPYVLGTGVDNNGNQILPETWSVFPDARKQQVKIQLKKSSTNEVILEHNFFGSEVNNKEFNLYYEGATDTDKQVIESYGGIHMTPTELVDIKPYLSSDDGRYDATSNIKIGDSLILRFEYYINGQMKHDDEKFSVAGNQEGIYIVLSKVQTDPYLDTNSRVLLRGNVGLAREYLSRVQKAGELWEKSLDFNYNITFSRAVVTQNRVLNKVDGTPTTFDFKGLTLDASTCINDWSNRGNYKNHRKDFRLLWGLEASYQEGQIFKDIAGLDGISTVKGLQYAYVNPSQYTVHIIKSANESVIDTLALSANTKANMHADVQAGNTIVTPNKFVGSGNWNGIFYVSLDPEWTGTYAIGEQTQSNGGWTTNQYTLKDWDGENSSHYYAYQYDNGPQQFIYKEDKTRNILCNIKTVTYNQIVGGNIYPGWRQYIHGLPCMDDNENGPYMFDSHDHRLVVSTDGVYFGSESDNYHYWESNSSIVSKYYSRYPDKNIDISDLYVYWGTLVYKNIFVKDYWFDEYGGLGVYSPYYKDVYEIVGPMGEKYESSSKIQNKYVPNLLGFPLSERMKAAISPDGTTGYYQQFTNGTMYKYESFFDGDSTHIVYGKWNTKHSSLGGTGGIGFPESDVGYSTNYGGIVQKFESKICYDSATSPYCENRTFAGNLTNGLEGFYDTVFLVDAFLTIRKNNLVINDYQEFVNSVSNASDNWDNRKHYCRLYMSNSINSLSSDIAGDATWYCAFLPEKISFYKSKKSEVQNLIPQLQQEVVNANQKLYDLQDAMEVHVANAGYSASEWLGYFSVDIASLIFTLGGSLGANVTKDISISIARKYTAELISGEISRSVLAKTVRKEVQSAITKAGLEIAEEELDEVVSRAVVKAVKEAGSKAFTKGGNSLAWSLDKNFYRKQITSISNGFNIFTDFGSGSRYETQFLNDGKDWVIKQAFKGNIQDPTFYSSNVILDQYFQVLGKSSFNVKNVKLDTIINKEALELVESQGKGAFMNSPIGKMAGHVVEDAGKEIKQVIVGDIVYDPAVQGGKYFNVEILLK